MRTIRRHINAVGFYGMGNFGDELFVSVALENSDFLFGSGARVRTFAPRSTGLYSRSDILGILLRGCARGVGACWGDTVAFCGGSTLQSVDGWSRVRAALFPTTRVELLGVSVGPFADRNAEFAVRRFVARATRIVVRDQRSLSTLRRWGTPVRATVGGDLAALSPYLEERISEDDLVTVCPSRSVGSDPSRLVRYVESALSAFRDATGVNPIVNILALNVHPSSGDREISFRAAAELRRKGWNACYKSFGSLGLQGTTQLLGRSRIVISERLHGAIAAYLSSTPFMIVGHHAKCVDFAEDIGLRSELLLDVSSPDWGAGVVACLANGTNWRVPPTAYTERAVRGYRVTESSGTDEPAFSDPLE